MERLDLLGPEPGDFQHLHQTRLHRGLQLLEKIQPSRRVQLRHFLHERLTETFHRTEFFFMN